MLLLTLLLMVIYGLPSEGLLKCRTSSFSRNREGLLNEKVLALLLETLLSNDPVSMDGGLLQVGHPMPRNPVDHQQLLDPWSHSSLRDLPAVPWRHGQGGFRRRDTEEGRHQKLPWDGLQQRHPPQ